MTNASVTAADGTMICYERRGNGDPVIVVNTVAEDRSGLSGLAELLAEHFTVYTYDRRGRGDSGDTKGQHGALRTQLRLRRPDLRGHSGRQTAAQGSLAY